MGESLLVTVSWSYPLSDVRAHADVIHSRQKGKPVQSRQHGALVSVLFCKHASGVLCTVYV